MGRTRWSWFWVAAALSAALALSAASHIGYKAFRRKRISTTPRLQTSHQS